PRRVLPNLRVRLLKRLVLVQIAILARLNAGSADVPVRIQREARTVVNVRELQLVGVSPSLGARTSSSALSAKREQLST
ncbi:MAG TPA: hypothetical protein VLR92_00780, partial [Blastocatellia bacterium]|nr:hypothetical protein [Blastocatellia bacterium]